MDWKSKRVEALLEQALLEDKATSDTTTALTIDPAMRATATVLAKQECVISGIGCIPRFLTLFRSSTRDPSSDLKSSAIPKFLTAFAFAEGRRSQSSGIMRVCFWHASA